MASEMAAVESFERVELDELTFWRVDFIHGIDIILVINLK